MRLGRTGCVVIGSLGLLLIAACLTGVFAITTLGMQGRVSAQQTLTPRIVYGLTFMPSGFDPHVNQNSELGIVFRSVYDTLLYRDPNTKQLVPGLADKVDKSADGLEYTFHLRSGVKFHDGEPFDAYAVAATLDRIVNPDTKSTKALTLLGPYSRYEVIDPQQIKVILNAPYAPILDAFSQVYLGIASPKALKENDAATYQFHQVGTGPFKLVNYVPGEKIILQRNPDYVWGPEFYQTPTAESVQEIEFRFFTDPATRAPALETGEAQIMGELAPTDAMLFARGSNGVQLLPQVIPGQPLQFFINTSLFPTNDLNVRKALLMLTDRTAIVDSVFQQFSPVACGPLSATTPFYDPKVCDLIKFDPQAGRDLLGQAGYADTNNDGYLDKNDGGQVKNLHIVIVTPGFGMVPEVVQKLQSQWKEYGIEVEIRQVANLAAILAEFDKGDYHMVAFTDYGLDASIINNYYRSDGVMNFTKWKNTDLDAWLDRAVVAEDTERAALYSQIQTHIMENALILPIRDYVNLNGAAASINGLTYDAYGWFPLLANVTVIEQK